MSKKLGKYIFTLKNIDHSHICKKYSINMLSNIDIIDENQPDKTTKISELSDTNIPQIVSFLSESKSIVKCNVIMCDLSGRNLNDIDKQTIECYWCRHPFNSQPIGCPIRYHSNQLIKTYYSEISKDKYTIKENITGKKSKKLLQDTNKKIKCSPKKQAIIVKESEVNDKDVSNEFSDSLKIQKNDYYETDGFFCSFNCCKAFILDNKHKPMYDCSNRLLIQLYNQIYNTKITNIKEADNWRLLKKSGGPTSIEKFRENFNHISYEYHGYISDICKPIGHLWEEHIKF
jgi:hypothetical protein